MNLEGLDAVLVTGRTPPIWTTSPPTCPALAGLGYVLRVREPAHRCLRLGEPGDLTNPHCYVPGSGKFARHLAFRDRLRALDAAPQRLCRPPALAGPARLPDVNHADAKDPLIREILGRAGSVG